MKCIEDSEESYYGFVKRQPKNHPPLERGPEPSALQHPQRDLPRVVPQSDLDFDVKDLLNEMRELTPSERERLIRSYA